MLEASCGRRLEVGLLTAVIHDDDRCNVRNGMGRCTSNGKCQEVEGGGEGVVFDVRVKEEEEVGGRSCGRSLNSGSKICVLMLAPMCVCLYIPCIPSISGPGYLRLQSWTFTDRSFQLRASAWCGSLVAARRRFHTTGG